MSSGLLKMAEGYELLAAGIRELAMADKPVKKEKAEKAVTEKVVEPEQAAEPTEAAVSIDKVRAVLAEKSRDGKTQEVRQLLNEFGADKLSAIPEEKLSDLLKKAEVL